MCCSKCQFVSYGTQCRAASGECDIAEYCGGRSSDCPPDRRVQDGTSCSKGVGYCYSGSCPTVDSQCKYFYGSSKSSNRLDTNKLTLRMYYSTAGAAGYASCFNNYNTRGDLHGNCGSTSTVGTYTRCSARCVYMYRCLLPTSKVLYLPVHHNVLISFAAKYCVAHCNVQTQAVQHHRILTVLGAYSTALMELPHRRASTIASIGVELCIDSN